MNPLRIGLVTCQPEKLAAYFPTRAEPDFLPTEPPFTPDDQLVVDELRRRGHRVEAVVWGCDPATLHGFDRLVIRSPWDYMDSLARRDAFVAWIASLAGLPVLNPPAILTWLLDKRYLLDLQTLDIPIVPTVYAEVGADIRLSECFAGPLVIKPATGAAGVGVVVVDVPDAYQPTFATRLEPFLVQPLLPEIRTAGEWSLVYLGGEYSHAIHKVPATGKILCHAEQGGSVRFASPPDDVRSAGDHAIARLTAAHERLLYLRIDLIATASGVLLSECEGVEPELFFRARPGSERRFADLVESI